MERFFRSLRSEWVPETDYSSLEHAKRSIVNYINGYYSQTRPHTFNEGLSPNAFERQHAKKRTACPKLLDHYSVYMTFSRNNGNVDAGLQLGRWEGVACVTLTVN